MKHYILPLLSLYSLSALPACASTPQQVPTPEIKANISDQNVFSTEDEAARNARFAAWKQDFMRRAIEKGYDEALVRGMLVPAQINEKAIERNKTQPEFSKPVWSYIDNAASPNRLEGGQEKLAQERQLFDAIEARYSVSRYYLTAIWGLETAYGKIIGNEDMISSLATLAFEGRRSAFGEQQLYALLDIIASGDVRPEQLKGSWAGAMGMTQFIPTTFKLNLP